MSSDPISSVAIHVESLGKRYRIGGPRAIPHHARPPCERIEIACALVPFEWRREL